MLGKRAVETATRDALVPFGPTVIHMGDPDALRKRKVRARIEQVQRLVNDPRMKTMAATAMHEDRAVARIEAALPDPVSCELTHWPDTKTLTAVAQVGVLFSLQVENEVIDPGLKWAASSTFADFHDEPVIDALFSWIAWMYFLGGTADSEQAFDAFVDGCLAHANDLRQFARR